MPLLFTRTLIKGRIAETIFEQMMREEERYEVIPFGYEHTVPTLSQYQQFALVRKVMENISDAPDFALVSHDRKQVYLVEVKYRSKIDQNELMKIGGKLMNRWNPSFVFVASPDGFYCSKSSTIAQYGVIKRLPESWVTKSRQNAYLKLLNEFEKS